MPSRKRRSTGSRERRATLALAASRHMRCRPAGNPTGDASMAEQSFTLTTFYSLWKEYQDRLKETLAPLTPEQLALRAGPGLRSVGENAAHIIGCRVGWFAVTLREPASSDITSVPWEDS